MSISFLPYLFIVSIIILYIFLNFSYIYNAGDANFLFPQLTFSHGFIHMVCAVLL